MNRSFLSSRRVSSPAGTAFSGISTYHSDLPSLRDDSNASAHQLPPPVDYQLVSQAHFNELEQYLVSNSAKNSPTRVTTTSKKLTRLTIRQFQELATDVYDEVRRKGENGVPFLVPRREFHPKRNQARQKLAVLPPGRFVALASDVYHELARRYPDLKDQSSTAATGSDYEDYPVSDFPNNFSLRSNTSDRPRTNSRRPSTVTDIPPPEVDPGVSELDDTILYLDRVQRSPTMSPKRKFAVMQEIQDPAPYQQRRRRPNDTPEHEEEGKRRSWVPVSCVDENRYEEDDEVLLGFGKRGVYDEDHVFVGAARVSDHSRRDQPLQIVQDLRRRMIQDSTPAFPFSQYRSGGVGDGKTARTLRLTYTYSDSDIRRIMEKLDKLFHEDKEWYIKILACRGAAAQRLLDLLQELLDYDPSFALIDRHRLCKALLRLSDHSKLYPTCFPLPTLQHEMLVAGGSFSDVYSGYLQSQCVAVKMMRVFAESDVEVVLKGFGREALIWRQLSHSNLLPFYGLYKFRQRLCLVSPWMGNGTIRAFLKTNAHDTDGLLSFILDVALGLEHLHAQGVVHGDLKGDNIFVTPSRRACIGDFGLSAIITSMSSVQFTHSSKNTQRGTVRYQAPELYQLEPGGQNDRRSDIYSFACVAYELLTGMAPFPDLTQDLAVIMAVREGRRPARPSSCTGTPALDALWSLLQDCWQGEPQRRPSASEIVERLKGDDIGASETRSGLDWDRALTSKFRRQLIGQLALPSVAELERIFFGAGTQ